MVLVVCLNYCVGLVLYNVKDGFVYCVIVLFVWVDLRVMKRVYFLVWDCVYR